MAGETSVEDRLSLRRLLRSSSGMSVAAVLSPALALPAGLLAARWLGPDAYGRGQAVLLIYMFATLLRSGVFEGGIRAFIHLSNSGDEHGARRAQNVAFTLEAALSLIPGLALACGAFFVDDRVRRVGLLLAPLAVLAASVSSYVSGLYAARERFGVVTRGSITRAVLAPAVLVLAVPWLGPSAIVVSPIVADTIVIAVLLRGRRDLGLALQFDAAVARPLLRVGFPLGLSAVVYWAYRMLGSSAVAIAEPAAQYGVYAFAVVPAAVIARAVASLHAVLTPAVWGEMADARRAGAWGISGGRATVLLALLAGLATNIGQAGFGPVVHVIAPTFVDAIPVFDLLSLNVLLMSIAAVPSLVLDSASVNRQVQNLGLWIGALVVNAVANALVLTSGHGLLAVAFNDIWVQGVVISVLYGMARRHLPKDWPERAVLGQVAACAALCLGVAALVRILFPSPNDLPSVIVSLIVRVAVAAGAWAVLALVIRRCRSTWSGGQPPSSTAPAL